MQLHHTIPTQLNLNGLLLTLLDKTQHHWIDWAGLILQVMTAYYLSYTSAKAQPTEHRTQRQTNKKTKKKSLTLVRKRFATDDVIQTVDAW
jgi:hypothetical protein